MALLSESLSWILLTDPRLPSHAPWLIASEPRSHRSSQTDEDGKEGAHYPIDEDRIGSWHIADPSVRAGDTVYFWCDPRGGAHYKSSQAISEPGVYGWGLIIGRETAVGPLPGAKVYIQQISEAPVAGASLAHFFPKNHQLFGKSAPQRTTFRLTDHQHRELARRWAINRDAALISLLHQIFQRLDRSCRVALGTADALRCAANQPSVQMEHLVYALSQEVLAHPPSWLLEMGIDEAAKTRLHQLVADLLPTIENHAAASLPPLSTHVIQALLHGYALAGPEITAGNLWAGAFEVADSAVIQAFPEFISGGTDWRSDQGHTPAGTELEGVGGLGGAANDEVAEKDQLGFADYVEAFADLIESPHTEPPVTIGIYGSWGMGKSFLLRNVGRELDRRRSAPAAEPSGEATNEAAGVEGHRPSRIFTVSFNAWEYSAQEKIWPGLVRRIMDHLARSIRWSRHGRFLTGLRRKLRREVESPSGLAAIGLAVIAASVLLVATAVSDAWKLGVAETAGVLFGTGAVGLLVKALATPWGQWVTRMVERQDYGRQSESMAEIREDLEFLQERLAADGGRILVLIDDLDRCEPEKAVEVLQAIKLLLNFKSFIVILGIDARVITGAIEKHYKGLLGPAGASGYEYLDKIVQIPFRIPEPTAEALDSFLHAQLGRPTERAADSVPEEPGDDVRPAVPSAPVVATNDGGDNRTARAGAAALEADSAGDSENAGAESSPTVPATDLPTRSTEPFTHREYQALKELIPYLHPNPRHIKRLINVYRLVRSLAQIKGDRRLLDNPEATILVLLVCAQWPYTAMRMLAAIPSLATTERPAKWEGEDEGDDGDDHAFPAEPPLGFLHRTVTDRLITAAQERLDLDQELLLDLMDNGAGELTWADLIAIRRYTVNFNPAVESPIIGVRPEATDPDPAPG